MMFQIKLICISDFETNQYGETFCLVEVYRFPSEFPFLIDYMRESLIIKLDVPDKK